MLKEDMVVTLPGEVTVTSESPKVSEVALLESDWSVGENEEAADIYYDTNGKGGGFGGGRHAQSFIMVGHDAGN